MQKKESAVRMMWMLHKNRQNQLKIAETQNGRAVVKESGKYIRLSEIHLMSDIMRMEREIVLEQMETFEPY